MEPITLKLPNEHHERAIKEFVRQLRPVRSAIIGGNGVEKLPFDTWIENTRDHRKAIALPKGLTPNTTLLVYEGKAMIGLCNIRHTLNKQMETKYGQLGMTLVPHKRNQGLGKATFEAIKTYAKESLHLTELLVIVPSDKPAMLRILESCGGTIKDVKKGTFIKLYRYTVTL